MRKVSIGIVIFSVLVAVIIVTGCVNPFGGILGNSEKGELKVVQEPDTGTLSLSHALRYCTSSDYGGHPLSQNVTLQYIQGRNVTESGNAEIWIIGINDNGNSSYYIVRPEHVKKMEWIQGGLRPETIQLQQILTPDILFSQNPQLFKNAAINGRIFEINLENGMYTIKPSINNGRILYRINAKSGEILP